MLEWKKFGEVCAVHTGSQLNRSDMLEKGTYPVINGGKAPSGYTETRNEIAKNITISQGGESAGFVNWIDTDFWAGAHCYVVENDESVFVKRFLYHYLKNIESDLQSSKQGAGIPGLNRKVLYNHIVPIPSLSEQSRIVSILDTFTDSIDNLKQQIEQRRKQYGHYRDQLLNFEGKEGVEMKMLNEFSKVLRGKRLTKNLLDDNAPYPVFHGGIEPLGKYGNYNREANSVMVINVGASAGTVGFCECRFWSSDGCFCISHSELFNNKFLYYYLQTKTHYLQSQVRHAGIPTLDNPVIERLLIPLLTLREQTRIVSILDTFESSIANLEEQLKLREKQYEYYRNKLLTFE